MRQKGQLSNEKNRFFWVASRGWTERRWNTPQYGVCQLFKPICKSSILFRFDVAQTIDFVAPVKFLCACIHIKRLFTHRRKGERKTYSTKYFSDLFAFAQILFGNEPCDIEARQPYTTENKYYSFLYERKQFFLFSSTDNTEQQQNRRIERHSWNAYHWMWISMKIMHSLFRMRFKKFCCVGFFFRDLIMIRSWKLTEFK